MRPPIVLPMKSQKYAGDKMKKVIVNGGQSDVRFKIESVEQKYNAKFVGQLSLRTRDGGWTGDSCGEVYYQAVPPVEGYSHYFALFDRNGASYITSGQSAVEGIINGVQATDLEIIYSRYRHDYRTSTDKSCYIDGGRDYVHGGLTGRYLSLKIVDGEWYEVEASDPDELTN